MSEIIGKRVVTALIRRLLKSDICYRKSDRIVMVDRQMTAKTVWQRRATGGHMQLQWNADLLKKIGPQKAELVEKIEAPAPSRACSVRWET